MDKSIFILGGTAWINLLNTTYISNKQKIDILADSSKTLQWLEANDLLRDSDALALENKELLDSLIKELQSFRNFSKIIMSDLEQHGKLTPNTTNELIKLVEQVKVNLTIVPNHDKLVLAPVGTTTEDHVLFNIIDSIIHTLENTSVNRIRKCEHPECILYYVDTSKSGRRRWCSMELCGNRKKVAEFYARKKKKL
ncbi:CGNR zinc finger domain-containing protein [Salipaludibacillus agaradhaerens]|jgi:predicted RNA-binding Zn ribbon-like protein|uniref:CGNR zinc finger domain-containing protein n=1 Tax=Salipaludibacillus agaradhaerens TaxID=76935 RepID=UPI0021508CF7|nr:CGNR zinc finger domain-containing protein [Salipaludibacillus agaradhaerens]MCR6105542.1 CGNR zinc finger domain-containing protein [Salipaludibacillus agaradhaerens]MCR6117579.1 CGNR zinc finger domain-containing protein [Salipaludibacillus agaradhaerens]